MKSPRALTTLATLAASLFLGVGVAQAMHHISGTISSTLTIYKDTQSVGNVTCTVTGAPCIDFGASHIKLRLNGFTITGLADPPNGCVTTSNFLPADGIDVLGRSGVAILGTVRSNQTMILASGSWAPAAATSLRRTLSLGTPTGF